MSVLAEERRKKIMKLIARDKNVLVKDLTAEFGVTNETIRKDLIQLEKEGKLIKTYGGAYVHEGARNDVPATLRETILLSKKAIIGKACAKLINDGDTIMLDASTTVFQIAKNIVNRENLTIITNALKVAEFFSDKENIKLILAGGTLDTNSLSFIGNDTKSILNQYFADISFVSCGGLSISKGITDTNEEQAVIRQMMLKRSLNKTVVADFSKFNLVKFKKICDFENIDTLIVDKLPDENWKLELKKRDIKIREAYQYLGG